ncbi:zinc finger, CCHC-type, retrotransposon gag domain protein [Tanacetum coccineum]
MDDGLYSVDDGTLGFALTKDQVNHVLKLWTSLLEANVYVHLIYMKNYSNRKNADCYGDDMFHKKSRLKKVFGNLRACVGVVYENVFQIVHRVFGDSHELHPWKNRKNFAKFKKEEGELSPNVYFDEADLAAYGDHNGSNAKVKHSMDNEDHEDGDRDDLDGKAESKGEAERIKDVNFISADGTYSDHILLSAKPLAKRVASPLHDGGKKDCNVKTRLESEKDIRLGDWKAVEIEILNVFQLLTAKPVVYLMVNTRTDAELAAAVQAAVDAMIPHIREQQKPRSFEKAVAPVDAENWISHMEKIFDVMDCEDAFKTRLAVYKFEGDAFQGTVLSSVFPSSRARALEEESYHSIRKRANENSTEYMQRFLRLAGFLGQAAGTAEEQAKNYRWGLHKSILDHVMCLPFTDVAQVADAARNLEILRDREDYDRSEQSNKRYKSEVPVIRTDPLRDVVIRSYGKINDRHGSTGREVGSLTTTINNNYNKHTSSAAINRSSGAGTRTKGTERDCKEVPGAGTSGHANRSHDASAVSLTLTQDQAAIYF